VQNNYDTTKNRCNIIFGQRFRGKKAFTIGTNLYREHCINMRLHVMQNGLIHMLANLEIPQICKRVCVCVCTFVYCMYTETLC
jgi:hypothetical protein